MRNFYPRLALVNLSRNGRYYGPYLLSCGMVAAMFYIFRYLTWNEGLQGVVGAGYLQSMMAIGCFVAALFAAVILFYANGFVMKQRRRELGLYNILGLEKRHIAHLMLWEMLYCAAVSILGGLVVGILLSKLILLLLLRLVQLPIQFGFSVSLHGVTETAALFGILFALTLAFNLIRLGRSKPIELLHSQQAGEREPKTKRLLTAIGLVTLLGGYGIALTVWDPVEALTLFFLAVVLVMIGTYCLFTAGSIAVLKALKKNPHYYYQTKHFTAVSGLLYRMKQNAVGLANICILATMVLVTVSTTVCLYMGLENALLERYPYDIEVIYDLDRPSGDIAETAAQVEKIVADCGRTVEQSQSFGISYVYCTYGSNTFSLDMDNGSDAFLELLTVEDYQQLTGETIQLEANEVLAWTHGVELPDIFYIGDTAFSVVGQLAERPKRSGNVIISKDEIIVTLVASSDTVDTITAMDAERPFTRYDLIELDLDGTDAEKLACFNAMLAEDGRTWRAVCRQDNTDDYYTLYGGFLFLGIFLGLLFLLATMLIIYYKQISEGYEDQRRCAIMRQVGMTDREIGASIRTQVLLVFFLPLLAAGLHTAMAFPMLSKMLYLFQIQDTGAFALCTVGTFLVFCVIYTIVYALTARAYGRIVGQREA
jgi:putative ABC transport system permease protein